MRAVEAAGAVDAQRTRAHRSFGRRQTDAGAHSSHRLHVRLPDGRYTLNHRLGPPPRGGRF